MNEKDELSVFNGIIEGLQAGKRTITTIKELWQCEVDIDDVFDYLGGLTFSTDTAYLLAMIQHIFELSNNVVFSDHMKSIFVETTRVYFCLEWSGEYADN